MSFDWLKALGLVIIGGIIPFAPSIYETLNKPKVHFLYTQQYKKNPIIEWNRQIELLFSEIESYSENETNHASPLILRKIGEEIYDALPAMIANIGFRPHDSMTVTISNVSRDVLKNFQVSFINCMGFKDYSVYPVAMGNVNGTSAANQIGEDSVTINYLRLPPSPRGFYSETPIVFWGEDASHCKPQIVAELDDGTPAIGLEKDPSNFYKEIYREEDSFKKKVTFVYRFLVLGLLLYLFFQVRIIKSKKK